MELKVLNELVEEELELAKKAKDYNAKKAEYNQIRLKMIDDDAVIEHYSNTNDLKKDKALLEDLFLELSYEQSNLAELFEEYNNKRSSILNGK